MSLNRLYKFLLLGILPLIVVLLYLANLNWRAYYTYYLQNPIRSLSRNSRCSTYLYSKSNLTQYFDGFSVPLLSFADTMKSLPWSSYQAAVNSKDLKEVQSHSNLLLHKLIPFLKMSPLLAPWESCIAPPLQIPLHRPCNSLPNPRKVGILLKFGFDVDALEIHLQELSAVADKFFIIEATKTHSHFVTTKPLMWDLLKDDPRFLQFSEKIVQFLVDDANLANANPAVDIWSREHQQEVLRWRKFVEWNEGTQYFKDSDLLGFGDVDEVPHRDNVYYLKHCEMPSDPVDIGIWFPMDGPDTVFSSDFPVPGHMYTLGDPTFWTLQTAKKQPKDKPPSSKRGKSGGYLLGGLHLSRYAYPPFQMVKMLAASESEWKNLKKLMEVGIAYEQEKCYEAETKLNELPGGFAHDRVQPLETLRDRGKAEAEAIIKMPWFLKCNSHRYPGFWKEHDSRLDAH